MNYAPCPSYGSGCERETYGFREAARSAISIATSSRRPPATRFASRGRCRSPSTRTSIVISRKGAPGSKIGRAHVRTPVNHAHLVCRLLREQKKHYVLAITTETGI